MSSIKYNPNPPRVWSRVQNRCSTDTADSTVNYAKNDYDRQMLLKGNILQYKKNSSNLTKNQRYTQIAKGMWTNRTKTWATQSDTYTNPNNSSLLRVNYTILDPSNNTFSSRSNPFNCPTSEIQDGGNLVCNVVVNPCTQEVIKRSVSQQLCNPTTDSDVPGQIQQLCWNDGTQTWYPRQRYTMGNSGTSWPEGYKGFVSALTPAAPVLILDSSNNNSITLSWSAISNDCIPISSFNIYQNGILIGNVLYPIHTITISIICGTNEYNVTSLSNDIESEPSNSILYISGKYSTTGTTNKVISGNYTYIYFLTSGTITFYCPINLDILVVGGGGGGGGGINSGSGGSGGGGGGINNVLNYPLLNTSYNITVGNGGLGGLNRANGLNGESTTFYNITATGGIGGEQNINNIPSSGYALNTGGLAGGPNSGGNGGNGSNNAGYSTNGQNAYGNPIIGNTTFTVSGGGGGATIANTSAPKGGFAGLNGIGGISGGYTGYNGENANISSYGSGGGGGTSTGIGGAGGQGIVILAFLTN